MIEEVRNQEEEVKRGAWLGSSQPRTDLAKQKEESND